MEWKNPPDDLNLNPFDVHVWQATLDRPLDQVTKFREILSVDEIERADRFKFDQHRNRFIVGRGILRSLLAQYLNLEPQQLEFTYGSYGKPSLEQASYLQFNLAHSHDHALYAMTYDRAIGIDIEQIREIKDLEALTRRFFSPSECRSICQTELESQAKKFFRYWTCKEAFLKATGEGLSQLQHLEIAIDQVANLEKIPSQTESIQNWCLKEIPLDNDFLGAIVVNSASNLPHLEYFLY
jgi:4'-phosphopantetheinyl transferase